MFHRFLLCYCFTAALFAVGCSRTIVPAAPDDGVYLPPPPPVESELHVPIQIHLDHLASMLNKQVPQELYADRTGSDIGYGTRIAMRIVRNGTIYITTEAGKVITHIPIKIADGRAMLPLGVVRPFDATMYISMTTLVAVDRYWDFVSTTSPDFVWGKEPTLEIAGGISVPLGRLTTGSVREQLRKIAPMIDEQIRGSVNLRKNIESLWQSFAEPRLATDAPAPVWLTIHPTEIIIAPLTSLNEKTLQLNLGIKTFISTSVMTRPMVQNLGAVPPLNIRPVSDNAFLVRLPIVLRYDDIRTLAKAQTRGQRFEVQKGVTLEVRDIDIFARGDKLAVMVDFITYGKKAEGKFFLVGKPVLNTETQTLSLDDLDFDIKSRNVLLGSANFLLHQTLLNRMRENLRFPLTEQLEGVRTKLQATLNRYQATDNIYFSAKIEDLGLRNVLLGKDWIQIYTESRGNIEGHFVEK